MQKNIIRIGITLTILAIMAIIIAGWNEWKSFELIDEKPIQNAIAALASLFVVATLLERSLAVFNRIILSDEKVKARAALGNAQTLAKASAMFYGATHRPYVHDVQRARLLLDVTHDREKWLRLCIGFFIASLIAISGFQILANFVDPTSLEKIDTNQKRLFIGIDIFLTAGLLAGGSQGIAEIIIIIKDALGKSDSTKKAEMIVASVSENSSGLDLKSAGVLPLKSKTSSIIQGKNVYELRRQLFKPDLTWLGGVSVNEYISKKDEYEHHDSAAYLETGKSSKDRFGTRFDPSSTPWRLAKSLEKLREQINEKYPNRNKASDGTIGDANHCPGDSDHCPNQDAVVTAFDCTHDPANDCDMGKLTEKLRKEKDSRIKYVIYNRRMYSSYKSDDGVAPWTWRPYNKENPHIKHAHFSVEGEAVAYDDESVWKI